MCAIFALLSAVTYAKSTKRAKRSSGWDKREPYDEDEPQEKRLTEPDLNSIGEERSLREDEPCDDEDKRSQMKRFFMKRGEECNEDETDEECEEKLQKKNTDFTEDELNDEVKRFLAGKRSEGQLCSNADTMQECLRHMAGQEKRQEEEGWEYKRGKEDEENKRQEEREYKREEDEGDDDARRKRYGDTESDETEKRAIGRF